MCTEEKEINLGRVIRVMLANVPRYIQVFSFVRTKQAFCLAAVTQSAAGRVYIVVVRAVMPDYKIYFVDLPGGLVLSTL